MQGLEDPIVDSIPLGERLAVTVVEFADLHFRGGDDRHGVSARDERFLLLLCQRSPWPPAASGR